ncbi:ATP-binding protein [Pusillimonas sp. MFBS29]|uniref:ATP-binding protein n=1 Tax=Pusillimonas sp. MFBS29 TaxID=2886690 RepID=UPI001D0FC5DE|nr:ATP-binding protein [Pusillimonas sp. MFBS29]MCC2597573.1 ATP-binding protein [Pusillimonas sp. MFBS29]
METIATLSLVPDHDASTQALAWLESIAEQLRWPRRTAHKLKLCLDEALTNVALHGFKDHTGQPHIRLVLMHEASNIMLDIIDNGLPFDPTAQAAAPLAATLDETGIGGHGLRLMRHYLQDIQYHRTEQHNHLRLVAAIDPVEN